MKLKPKQMEKLAELRIVIADLELNEVESWDIETLNKLWDYLYKLWNK